MCHHTRSVVNRERSSSEQWCAAFLMGFSHLDTEYLHDRLHPTPCPPVHKQVFTINHIVGIKHLLQLVLCGPRPRAHKNPLIRQNIPADQSSFLRGWPRPSQEETGLSGQCAGFEQPRHAESPQPKAPSLRWGGGHLKGWVGPSLPSQGCLFSSTSGNPARCRGPCSPWFVQSDSTHQRAQSGGVDKPGSHWKAHSAEPGTQTVSYFSIYVVISIPDFSVILFMVWHNFLNFLSANCLLIISQIFPYYTEMR